MDEGLALRVGKAARLEFIGHQLGGTAISRPPGPPVGLRFGDGRRAGGRQSPIEEHVRGQPLCQRPGAALQGEHRQHERQ